MTKIINQNSTMSLNGGTLRVTRDDDGDLVITKSYDEVGIIQTDTVYVTGETVVEFVKAIQSEFNLVPAVAKVGPLKKSPNGPQAYKGNGKHDWETVVEGDEDDDVVSILRLRVPGGWLYSSDDDACPMTFVPTPAVVGYAI